MRSQGNGIIKLEAIHTKHLNDYIKIISTSTYAPLESGMYSYKIEQLQIGQPSIILHPVSHDRGIHDSFWKHFCTFLGQKSENVSKTNLANASEFIAGTDEVVKAIKSGGSNGNIWLSALRNEINYQHKHNTWFPLRKDKMVLKSLGRNSIVKSKTVRLDISKEKDPIAAFVNTSRYLACLNIELSEFVAKRSSSGRSFGQKWRRITEKFEKIPNIG